MYPLRGGGNIWTGAPSTLPHSFSFNPVHWCQGLSYYSVSGQLGEGFCPSSGYGTGNCKLKSLQCVKWKKRFSTNFPSLLKTSFFFFLFVSDNCGGHIWRTDVVPRWAPHRSFVAFSPPRIPPSLSPSLGNMRARPNSLSRARSLPPTLTGPPTFGKAFCSLLSHPRHPKVRPWQFTETNEEQTREVENSLTRFSNVSMTSVTELRGAAGLNNARDLKSQKQKLLSLSFFEEMTSYYLCLIRGNADVWVGKSNFNHQI